MQQLNRSSDKGTYIIILYLREEKQIEIGHLGKFRFSGGYYAYVGSALCDGGLNQRISHHLTTTDKPHWHIDFLRNYSKPVEVWMTKSQNKLEHIWAEALNKLPGGNFFLKGFGASDCKCISHLYHFGSLPSFQNFTNLLGLSLRKDNYNVERMEV